MNISVTEAAKEWGISRTTIYQKVKEGELSRTADKKIDTSEMLRVFGEPAPKKCTEQLLNTSNITQLNSQNVQSCTDFEHQLELEKLKNEHLRQQVSDQKQLIENYQQQINQLNETLRKANASIQNFAQVKLLEFKKSASNYEPKLEKRREDTTAPKAKKKRKRLWGFW